MVAKLRPSPKAAAEPEARPGDTIGGEGRPIRDYIGWDEAAGVFRQDDPALRPTFRATRRPKSREKARQGRSVAL